MDDFVPPAYGADRGAPMARPALIAVFVQGARRGHSTDLWVEDGMLVTAGGAVTAFRLQARVLLVRAPGVLADPAADIVGDLAAIGLSCVVADPPLADVVSLMISGLRGTPWDLWGEDIDTAVRALESAAVGDARVDLDQLAGRVMTDLLLQDYEHELS